MPPAMAVCTKWNRRRKALRQFVATLSSTVLALDTDLCRRLCSRYGQTHRDISPFPPSFDPSVQRSIFTKFPQFNGIRIVNYELKNRLPVFPFFLFFFLWHRVLTFSTSGPWKSIRLRGQQVLLDDKFIYLYNFGWRRKKGGILFHFLFISKDSILN